MLKLADQQVQQRAEGMSPRPSSHKQASIKGRTFTQLSHDTVLLRHAKTSVTCLRIRGAKVIELHPDACMQVMRFRGRVQLLIMLLISLISTHHIRLPISLDCFALCWARAVSPEPQPHIRNPKWGGIRYRVGLLLCEVVDNMLEVAFQAPHDV